MKIKTDGRKERFKRNNVYPIVKGFLKFISPSNVMSLITRNIISGTILSKTEADQRYEQSIRIEFAPSRIVAKF